jgi:hypothetical protein
VDVNVGWYLQCFVVERMRIFVSYVSFCWSFLRPEMDAKIESVVSPSFVTITHAYINLDFDHCTVNYYVKIANINIYYVN